MQTPTPTDQEPNFDDPRHLKSDHAPCEWCGAKWTRLARPGCGRHCSHHQGSTQSHTMVMDHKDDCEYIAWCNAACD